ncbi:hypothetical protein P3T76_009015 [Phytophthora citrophthora]|uniref:Uncharacterized protein n=1 Tax=Phytophthora citrophthora TaxID=4793 RepID=A0AAD9GIA1_9STRA|nr:hypothetical protein P3T76_009015 [Phytophthora citrophthora]
MAVHVTLALQFTVKPVSYYVVVSFKAATPSLGLPRNAHHSLDVRIPKGLSIIKSYASCIREYQLLIKS